MKEKIKKVARKIKNTDYYYFIFGNHGNNLFLFISPSFATIFIDDSILLVAVLYSLKPFSTNGLSNTNNFSIQTSSS